MKYLHSLSALIVLLFTGFRASSQYIYVTHATGTAIVGTSAVTVTPIANPTVYFTTCGINFSYWIGTGSTPANAYKYQFSPVINKELRLNMLGMNTGEVISFYINGSHYSLTSANISALGGICAATALPTTSGGDIVNLLSTSVNFSVDIPATSIDSIRIQHSGTGLAGTAYNFGIKDTTIAIVQPFNDTLICVGDTLSVPFNAFPAFATGNVFTLQLSNASGSFASPTSLTTITGTGSGIFKYFIPATITTGTGYRIRLVASNPARISDDNGKNIVISNVQPGKPVITSNSPVCAGDTLKFTASSTTPGLTYKWNGPNGFSSLLQNVNINNATSVRNGQYIVSARLGGCASRDTTYATVAIPGSVQLAAANGPICVNDTARFSLINFSNTSPSITYTWSGPNSFSSASTNPIIPNAGLSASGDYILSINLSTCTLKDTVSLVVNNYPANHAATGNSPVCSNDTLKLTAASSTLGITYGWSGPSFTSLFQNPSIINPLAGNYIVSYTNNGCTVKDTINVVVNQAPLSITASSNTPICQADTLKIFSSNSNAGVTWSWTGPNTFTATTQNTYIANSQLIASGRYYVRATGANGCYRKDSVDVIVKPLPQNVLAASNTPICQGGTLTFTGSSTTTGASFSWSGPNTYSSTTQNPFISNAQPPHSGNYILTATLNGCVLKDTETVNVIAIPATPLPTANTPVCVGQTLNLNAGVTAPGYIWTGPGFASSLQNPSLPSANNTMAGSYTVKAVDGACVSATSSINVTVIAAPVASAYPSPKDSICVGSPVNFFASSSNAGTSPQYKWFRNNTLITGANISSYNTTTVADYDEYFCTVTSNGTCTTPFTDTGNKIIMRVFPWLAPSVSIAATPNGTIQGGDLITFNSTPVNGGNFPGYQWKRNNKNEIGATGNTWGAKTLSDKDVVCVEMSSSYLCPQPKTANSNCITVSVNTTGISGTKLMQGVSIYPNPITNELTIEGISQGTTIQLFDVLGRTVISTKAAKEKVTLHTSTLAPGNYLLQLTATNGERMNAKLVKE